MVLLIKVLTESESIKDDIKNFFINQYHTSCMLSIEKFLKESLDSSHLVITDQLPLSFFFNFTVVTCLSEHRHGTFNQFGTMPWVY